MDNYNGTNKGKTEARSFTHDAMYDLNSEAYDNSKHLYLAGLDAGDIPEAAKRIASAGKSPHDKQLFAAEKIFSRVLQAKAHLKSSGWKYAENCVHHCDAVDLVKDLGMMGVMFIDTCGTLISVVPLVRKLLPYLQNDGTIAINLTYGRDGLMRHRWQERYNLSPNLQYLPHWKAVASARIANDLVKEYGIFFSLAISYENTGPNKRWGVPMLTLVGRRSTSLRNQTVDPIFFCRYGFGGKKEYQREAKPSDGWGNGLTSYKAHLPSSFKSLIRSW